MFTRRLFIAKKIIKTTNNLNEAFELWRNRVTIFVRFEGIFR